MESTEIFYYLLKASLILSVFYGFYFLLLSGKNSHTWNRAYLLITLLLSVTIPVVENPFPESAETIAESVPIQWVGEPVLVNDAPANAASVAGSAFTLWMLVNWAYFGVVMAFIFRSIIHLMILQKLKKQSVCIKKYNYNLYKTSHSQPFSFLSSVFIPDYYFGTKAFDQVLEHECAHVRQRHSYDRLLVDFFVTLFWFNPFMYLYRKALIEVHEYLADEEVLQRFDDPVAYQEVLYTQASPKGHAVLMSHFNFSTLKKRIVMMNKRNKTKKSGWYYFLAVPVVITVTLAFSPKSVDNYQTFIHQDISLVDEQEGTDPKPAVNNVPAIFPLIFDQVDVRLSSGFGMRNDPFKKQIRLHNGLDIVAPEGCSVITTADGEVIEVNENAGHGKYIIVRHGIYQTRYNHLSGFAIKQGDQVKRGQLIGYVGNTGNSTGPHLHYEIIKNGENINPINFIKDYQLDFGDGC